MFACNICKIHNGEALEHSHNPTFTLILRLKCAWLKYSSDVRLVVCVWGTQRVSSEVGRLPLRAYLTSEHANESNPLVV